MLQALHVEQVVEGIATRLDTQEDQVTAVRRDLRSVLRAKLVAFMRLDPEQAREWVERTLRCPMLSIIQIRGDGTYYTSIGRDDYLLNGGEPRGVWLGEGAEAGQTDLKVE